MSLNKAIFSLNIFIFETEFKPTMLSTEDRADPLCLR